jgi:Leucine-rich repeat (LRR) protein
MSCFDVNILDILLFNGFDYLSHFMIISNEFKNKIYSIQSDRACLNVNLSSDNFDSNSNIIRLQLCKERRLFKTIEISYLTNYDWIFQLYCIRKIEKIVITECCEEDQDMEKILNGIENLEIFSIFENLKELSLDGCQKMTSLKGIEKLEFLEVLHFDNCSNLSCIWTTITKLRGLKKMVLEVPSHTIIPDEIRFLTNLEILSITAEEEVYSMPVGLGNLTQLRELTLSGFSWSNIPEVIVKLTNLFYLNISYSENLTEFPVGLEKLTKLRYLDITAGFVLEYLPVGIGKLYAMEELNLSHCQSLAVLPEGIGKMTSLKGLNVSSCGSLQQIPFSIFQLSGLNRLNYAGCTSLDAHTRTFAWNRSYFMYP